MKINKKLIPIKAHYFCLLGSVSTVLPFIMVIAAQMGIPVSISGPLTASILVVVVFVKPVIATLADMFSSLRRFIFLLNLTLLMIFMISLYFVPSMQQIPKLQGQLIKIKKNENSSDLSYLFSGRDIRQLDYESAQCKMIAASDCMFKCNDCTQNTERFNLVAYEPGYEEENNASETNFVDPSYWSRKAIKERDIKHYWLKGLTSFIIWKNISIECPRPTWVGPSCTGVYTRWEFWVFATILVVVNITVATVLSFTDAIIIDTIGTEGNYGAQRAWGTIGWGTIAPISGVLVDFWSESTLDKNLAPAFIVYAVLAFADLIISMVFLKTPAIKSSKPVLEEVLPLLKQPHFLVFCIFVIINGAFDGFSVYFLLLMQEDMAKGTSAMENLKFLQGLTLFVQCSLEAPLMFVNHWFMERFGTHRVISFVFLLYCFRMFGLAMTGMWGPVWSTLLVELLNGPCYGLGFTAVVSHAANLSPKGTNTTIQSLVNVLYECFGYGISLFFGGLLCDVIGCPTMYLVLGILAVFVFIIHVSSMYFCPTLNGESKHKNVHKSQEIHDSKMIEEQEDSHTREERIYKDNISEDTRL